MIVDKPTESAPTTPPEPAPPPFRRRQDSGTLQGASSFLDLTLSRGNTLRIGEQQEGATFIQISPAHPLDACSVLSGVLSIPAPSSILSCAVRLIGCMESLATKTATAPASSAHPTPQATTVTAANTTVLFKAASARHAPQLPDDDKEKLAHPFTFELPSTMGSFPTPPSLQREGYGVRYFLEVVVQRKTFCLRRHSSDIIPVVYIPLSSPPTPNVEPSRPVEKGSPSLPPKDGQGFVETSIQLEDAHIWASVLVSNHGVAARGAPLDVRISVACDPQMADRIIPSCFSVKLRDMGQASGAAAAPKTIVKSNEVTYYPSHLLPRPSAASTYAVGALDLRAFTATLDLGNDVVPSFETTEKGPRMEYILEVKLKIPNTKIQSISAPLRVVNSSRAPYELPKAYHKRDAKGGMKSAPALV